MVARTINKFKSGINTLLFVEKLNNPLGYLLLMLLALVVGFAIAILKLKLGIVLLAAILGIPILGACFINTRFGINMILAICFFVQFIGKYTAAPIGTLLDALIFLMLFGILVNQVKSRDWSFMKNPISAILLIWIAYNFIQVINPTAASKIAWVYTVRSMAGQSLLFFIGCYAFTSYKSIKTTIKVIIAMVTILALYGLKQEFFGFNNTEMAWLTADPERFQLIFQWSRMRIFSLLSDPTTLGIVMAYMALFCIILITGPFKNWQKIALGIATICMLMTMAYAGSRTPVVLFPFGIIVFMILTLKKEYLIGGLFFFLVGVAFVMKGSSNAVIFRIQSAFKPGASSDTMDVRFKNQKRIQPFIHSHPFGAGLGSTGLWGRRFTPDSFLAKFAHDSGFVRVAVELGWIGLIIYMVFLFLVLKTSIKYYLRVKDPEIKVIYLGLTIVFFVLTLASYPQEAIVQLPTSIIFSTMLAIMVRLKEHDEYYQEHYEQE
ncbi:MAG: putative inorganic carbon (HCO3(-)) transporter [Saprospiraceae bacterium]|jgi:putative inorganic carbon (HCO3(-)) transporter